MQSDIQKACKFGFIGKSEFIPEMFANLEKQKIAKIFLTLYNASVDERYKILPKFAKNCTNLEQIFTNFIEQNLAKKPLNFTKVSKFCIASNVIIFSFLQNKSHPNLANLPEMKVANLILLLRNNFDFGIILFAQNCFKNLIFDKVSCKNKNCKISIHGDIIVIEKGKFRLGLLPNFREITDLNSANFDADIKSALLQKPNLRLDTLYLIYPRSEYFRHHVEIKSSDFAPNFTMKLVPYSINNKIF